MTTALGPTSISTLARRLGVPAQLIPSDNPGAIIAAFRAGAVDFTFLGITAVTRLAPLTRQTAAVKRVGRPP
jgi:hypothetical protein